MKTDENIKQFFDTQSKEYFTVPGGKFYSDESAMIPTKPDVLFGSLFFTKEEMIFSDASGTYPFYSVLGAGGFPLAGAAMSVVAAGFSALKGRQKKPPSVEKLKKKKYSITIPYSEIIAVMVAPVRSVFLAEDFTLQIVRTLSLPKEPGKFEAVELGVYKGFTVRRNEPIQLENLPPDSGAYCISIMVPKEVKKEWKAHQIKKSDGVAEYSKNIENIFRSCITYSLMGTTQPIDA